MKRATIALPDELAGLTLREARRRGTSVSEVVRQALSAFLGRSPDQPRHIPFASLGRSGQTNIATDMEELLAREWDAYRDR